MRLFLTGGTGFIGQALVRAVRRRGWSLSVLVRDPASASPPDRPDRLRLAVYS